LIVSGTYCTEDGGLYYQPPDKDGETPERKFVSAVIHVRALATDDNGEWGKLLEWLDYDGQAVCWVMPTRYLFDEKLLLPELLKRGLHISDQKDGRQLLRAYLNRQTPHNRARLVSRFGWQDGANVYVLPDETIGDACEIEFLPLEVKKNPYKVSGTVEEWINHVGKYCAGNSRLIFAVSTVLASPLLRFTGDQNCILHFVGASGKGKSTAGYVGTSIAGHPKTLEMTWNNTTNGFEGTCAERNDGAMNLDEIGQANPNIVGDVIYMVANGVGKGRMNRDSTMRAVNHWRMLAISTGEVGLAEKLAMANKQMFAGQEVRLLEIPADAGAGMGIVETLHGFESSERLIMTLNENARLYHGAVFREFISKIASIDPQPLVEALRLKRDAFVADVVPEGASSQVLRAAHIFGLICTAGMLASDLGLTGWTADEAKNAAVACFNAWLIKRETIDDLEIARGIEQVMQTIATQDARFEEIDAPFPVANKLGFKEEVRHGAGIDSLIWEYYIYPEAWKKEVCRGFNAQTIGRAMAERGWLRRDGTKLNPVKRLGRYGRKRMYHITSPAFFEPDTQTPEQRQADAKRTLMRNLGLDDEAGA
jgi:putative DNA primase/helicase